jgi:hypothetical protein
MSQIVPLRTNCRHERRDASGSECAAEYTGRQIHRLEMDNLGQSHIRRRPDTQPQLPQGDAKSRESNAQRECIPSLFHSVKNAKQCTCSFSPTSSSHDESQGWVVVRRAQCTATSMPGSGARSRVLGRVHVGEALAIRCFPVLLASSK